MIHTALPGSLEAYYQEIGRAGRDGDTSRAILMQSYADRHTHDFFFSGIIRMLGCWTRCLQGSGLNLKESRSARPASGRTLRKRSRKTLDS